MSRSFKIAGGKIAAAALALSAVAAQAHHSFAGFDMTQSETISGTVTQWQWTNPHSWLEMDVAGTGGAKTHYSFEGGSVYLLSRQKLTRHSFKPGDQLVVTYHPLRTPGNGGSLEGVKTPDGKVLMGGGPGVPSGGTGKPGGPPPQ